MRFEDADGNSKTTQVSAGSVHIEYSAAYVSRDNANQNILIQAGQAMMAQANQSRQGILSLLS